MNMNLVNEITASQIRTDLPSFSSGDTIKVHVRITEGDKSRIQIFEGVVMSTRGNSVSKTFTVRKISAGQVGVEVEYESEVFEYLWHNFLLRIT